MCRYHTRQGANLVLEAPKHDPLIKLPTWGHMNVWKIYISTFMRFIANKLGRVLIFGKIFSMQTLKSSPTSCWVVHYIWVFNSNFNVTNTFSTFLTKKWSYIVKPQMTLPLRLKTISLRIALSPNKVLHNEWKKDATAK